MKAVKCSQCGFSSALTRDECIVYLGYRTADSVKDELAHGENAPLCEKCGAEISQELTHKVTPLECNYSGIVCGYPCGRHQKKRVVGDSLCMKQTPLRKLKASA